MLTRWFSRLRRPVPDDADAAARGARRARDEAVGARPRVEGLLLLNLQPVDGREQIETAPPLGERGIVIRALETAVPGMQFDAGGRGRLDADDHRVTIDLGPQDPVHAAVASADGGRGIRKLGTAIVRQGWRIYVPRSGEFVEPERLDRLTRPVPGALDDAARQRR